MLRKFKIFTALLMLTGFVSSANGAILLEPYAGYYFGKWKQGAGDSDYSSVGFGARVGYTNITGIMLGLDYMTGKYTDKATVKNDLTPSQLGLFVGFEFPILLRVYGVYNFMDKLEVKNSVSKVDYKGDSGIKLGVGFTPLPLLSVNLEYGMSDYDEANDNSISNNKFETSYYGLSVSVPLEF